MVPVPERCQQLLHPGLRRYDFTFADAGKCGLLLLHGPVTGQAQLVDEFGELQPQQNDIYFGVVTTFTGSVLMVKIHRRIAVNGGQVVAQPGI